MVDDTMCGFGTGDSPYTNCLAWDPILGEWGNTPEDKQIKQLANEVVKRAGGLDNPCLYAGWYAASAAAALAANNVAVAAAPAGGSVDGLFPAISEANAVLKGTRGYKLLKALKPVWKYVVPAGIYAAASQDLGRAWDWTKSQATDACDSNKWINR